MTDTTSPIRKKTTIKELRWLRGINNFIKQINSANSDTQVDAKRCVGACNYRIKYLRRGGVVA